MKIGRAWDDTVSSQGNVRLHSQYLAGAMMDEKANR